MVIEVQATKNGTIKDYGKVKGAGDDSYKLEKGYAYENEEDRGKISDLTNSSKSDTYVPVNASFEAHLIKNGDAVVGVFFKRK